MLESFLFFLVLLLVVSLCEPLAEKFKIPFALMLVIIGFVGSELATTFFHIDTGINWKNFSTIIFYIIVPLLLVQSAVTINIKLLFDNLFLVIFLSLPFMLIATLLSALGFYYGIGNELGFPWIAALLTGTLLVATDSSSVLNIIKHKPNFERVSILLRGENLFNDALAIVMFNIVLIIATSDYHQTVLIEDGIMILVSRYLIIFGGSILLGVITGVLINFLLSKIKRDHVQVILTISCAYINYILAEDLFNISGVISVLVFGLVIAMRAKQVDTTDHFLEKSWQLIGSIAEVFIFLLAGISITLSMFLDRWVAMLIGVVSVMGVRALMIYFSFALLNRLTTPVNSKEQLLLLLGGTRGTVTLALVLSLPLSLDYWYTIQSIGYGVVIILLFLNTVGTHLLIRQK